ncbi:hypothetical protein ERJ75_000267900 [Trypanosoma vivax]|uniref:Amastin n=1 Tax=Trypanosoma vivax (strain Y486) TaxID=1055687 RepID=G0UBZ4_TRYVY|nr:hypothetical protein TRVL_03607 [Trypanosoma vivax]KAH8609662.1 hypothetical protein ERJ75_001179200 [Trypanosoma vivax]KAH8618516.1 hypothetical protein ERJ75_000267900 [Trypanosoma vivax]CCC53342.1 conserved hypothetical protein [Trypanosoma vivax Y486]
MVPLNHDELMEDEDLKRDACSCENVILFIALLCSMVLTMVSLFVSLSYAVSGDYYITVRRTEVRGCLDERCDTFPVESILCEAFSSNTSLFVSSSVTFLVLGAVTIVLNLLSILGKNFASTSTLFFSAATCTLLLFISFTCSISTTSAEMCNGLSLQLLGFKYGPAVGLSGGSFFMLSLATLLHTCRCMCSKKKPTK